MLKYQIYHMDIARNICVREILSEAAISAAAAAANALNKNLNVPVSNLAKPLSRLAIMKQKQEFSNIASGELLKHRLGTKVDSSALMCADDIVGNPSSDLPKILKSDLLSHSELKSLSRKDDASKAVSKKSIPTQSNQQQQQHEQNSSNSVITGEGALRSSTATQDENCAVSGRLEIRVIPHGKCRYDQLTFFTPRTY